MKQLELYILMGLILTMGSSVLGQQDPHYTQYTYNMGIINPAYTASDEVTTLNLLARRQWAGVEGAPITTTFTFGTPVGKNVGLGLSVVHDMVGPVVEDNIFADFSYMIRLSDGQSKLAFGLKAGFNILNVAFLDPLNPDPLNVPINATSPNIGAGIFYFSNRFYAGLSVPNILSTRHLEKEREVVTTASEEQHYFLTSGLVFNLTNELKFKPSTMVKMATGSPISIDLSVNLLVNERFEAGLSHRIRDSISGMLGFVINDNFRIGYAYDLTSSKFGNGNFGTHEIMLTYRFYRNNVNSPRFF